MEQHYPNSWINYLTFQMNQQENLNFESSILHETQAKKELIELQNLLQDLHDALIFME